MSRSSFENELRFCFGTRFTICHVNPFIVVVLHLYDDHSLAHMFCAFRMNFIIFTREDGDTGL